MLPLPIDRAVNHAVKHKETKTNQSAVNSRPDHSTDTLNQPLVAIINPQSFRMSLRDRAEQSIRIVETAGGKVYRASQLSEIEGALAQAFAGSTAALPARLVIAGGDGTLQACVSWLGQHLDAEQWPDVILLGAGRTNYVAHDIGTGRNFLKTLDAMLTQPPGALQTVRRHTLQLEHPDLGQQIGFFVAGGLVDDVIREIHQWRAEKPGWHRTNRAATAIGLVREGLRWLSGKTRYTARPMTIRAEPLGELNGPCRLIIMTTLILSGKWINPYNSVGIGPLRINAIRQDAPAFKRRFLRLLVGRFTPLMNLENGYLSGYCSTISISNIKNIMIDGQAFDLKPSSPLRIVAGPTVRFLLP